MFSTNGTDYLPEYKARQKELEARAQNERLAKSLQESAEVSPVRRRVGGMLIELGKKVAREPQQDVRLVLSTRHQS